MYGLSSPVLCFALFFFFGGVCRLSGREKNALRPRVLVELRFGMLWVVPSNCCYGNWINDFEQRKLVCNNVNKNWSFGIRSRRSRKTRGLYVFIDNIIREMMHRARVVRALIRLPRWDAAEKKKTERQEPGENKTPHLKVEFWS